MRHYDLFWGEFGAGFVGVKYCSHTLLLHAWVSVRRARAHPEATAPIGSRQLAYAAAAQALFESRGRRRLPAPLSEAGAHRHEAPLWPLRTCQDPATNSFTAV